MRIEETLKLASELQEHEPKTIFYLASYLQIPEVNKRCSQMLKEAKRRYKAGELIRDGSRRRTLGGCWLDQLSEQERKRAYELRQEYRKVTGTLRRQVPQEFLRMIGL